MLEGQDDLENPGDTGRCFEMSDVGLGRTDQQWAVGARPLPSTAAAA